MTLEEYISKNYGGKITWFEDEVQSIDQKTRNNKVLEEKAYLRGQHKILSRKDSVYKGGVYKTRKIVLQLAETILNFHTTYLVGKPVTITGTPKKANIYQNIYKISNYDDIDFKIVDRFSKFGDAYEWVTWDKVNSVPKSVIINSEDGYPVYDNNGNYLAFIEYNKIVTKSLNYYTIYYTDKVEQWNNESGALSKVSEAFNNGGLPIHYHSDNYDSWFGTSVLDKLVPIIDELESLLSKASDAVYTYGLNPLPTVIGQQIKSNIDADAVGYALNLEDGADLKIPVAQFDYSTIKLLYDKLLEQLTEIAGMPSPAMGQSNIANVSETSLKILYQIADCFAMVNEKIIKNGLNQRIIKIDSLLSKNGISFNSFGDKIKNAISNLFGKGNIAYDNVNIDFNYSRPVNTNDIITNLQALKNMGAISTQTIMEKSTLINDVQEEMNRLKSENELQTQNDDDKGVVNEENQNNDGSENKDKTKDNSSNNEQNVTK